MSELIQKNEDRATARWKLLTGASALTLTAFVASSGIAAAEEDARPNVWIELGGQLSRLEDSSEIFSPDFPTARPDIFTPSEKFEGPPRFGFDEVGKISIQPDRSNWVFSASVQYGRANKKDHVHQQTYPSNIRVKPAFFLPTISKYPRGERFADTNAQDNEQHLVLDFQAGKDVGLGMFGKHGSSVVSLGVRFAQFRDKSAVNLKSDPDWHFQKHVYYYYSYQVNYYAQPYHSNIASFQAERSFHGVGPSLSWTASAPVAGDPLDGELNVDWSVNAAILFGRQKTRVQHETTIRYNNYGYPIFPRVHSVLQTVSHTAPPSRTRTRNVTVPNFGGSIGLSWRLQNFKMSFGYRADFFFGAVDGGIETHKSEDRAFFGPYASLSIGFP